MFQRRLKRIRISFKALSLLLRGELNAKSNAPTDLQVAFVHQPIEAMGAGWFYIYVYSSTFPEVPEDAIPEDFFLEIAQLNFKELLP